MIALLCPSRGRPEQLRRMVESAKATVNTDIKFYVAIAHEDLAGDYAFLVGKATILCLPDNMPTSHKWNLLADEARKNSINQIFMLAADDMIFQTPLWDEALINHYNALDKKQHVYHLQDSRDENGTPHPIMTREYIEVMGFFIPPIFLHWFIDSWTVEIAKANNCFTHLKDYLLVHDKPSDKGNPDETHSRIRLWGWHDRDKYVAGKMRWVKYALIEKLKAGIS